MVRHIVINGRVLGFPLNGIPRYVREIVCGLDRVADGSLLIELAIPDHFPDDLHLRHIHTVRLPQGIGWDYLQAERYARKKQAVYVNLASKGVFYPNSVAVIHDIRLLKTGDGEWSCRAARTWLKFWVSYQLAAHRARRIVTVSQSVKAEIQAYSARLCQPMDVIGNGWDHILAVQEDERIFEAFPNLEKGAYYLVVGSIAPHKNLRWVVGNARKYPSNRYVILGRADSSLWRDETGSFGDRITYVGFQSDERMKTLLLHAKGLVFPTLYEGFGIPPMEALAVGTPAIVSDIPVMHEIYGNTVRYLDPMDDSLALDEAFSKPVDDPKILLAKYRWDRLAEQWQRLLKEME